MSMKTKAAVIFASVAVLGFMAFGEWGGVRASSNDGAYRQLEVYSEVLSRVRSEYVEEPNIPKVTDGALHGLLESLDANSSFLTAPQYKEFKSRNTDMKADIGAGISKRFGYATVISVIPGGPADKAGVEGSDIFEAIEGQSTRDMSLAQIRSMLAGQPGSNVTVSVVRARRAEPQKTVITRDVVSVPGVSDKMMEDGIAYLKVDALPKGKSQEIGNRVKALQKQGAKKLILDLRNASEG
jgi:carboxyl-terminal processing protease